MAPSPAFLLLLLPCFCHGTDVYGYNERVFISEVLTTNTNGPTDSSGTHSGWLELHNAQQYGGPVRLGGWCLSLDPAVPCGWRFPAGTTLQNDEDLLVFAAGKTDRPGPSQHGATLHAAPPAAATPHRAPALTIWLVPRAHGACGSSRRLRGRRHAGGQLRAERGRPQVRRAVRRVGQLGGVGQLRAAGGRCELRRCAPH